MANNENYSKPNDNTNDNNNIESNNEDNYEKYKIDSYEVEQGQKANNNMQEAYDIFAEDSESQQYSPQVFDKLSFDKLIDLEDNEQEIVSKADCEESNNIDERN